MEYEQKWQGASSKPSTSGALYVSACPSGSSHPSTIRKTCPREPKPFWPGHQNEAQGDDLYLTPLAEAGLLQMTHGVVSTNLQTHEQEINAYCCVLMRFFFVVCYVAKAE